ncbi:hypothetical protein CTEN210_16667 [Chaetoceros tenuissimus]|uniref:Cyclin-dependent kinase 2 homolog n=1 Tax=Chaetoceros tenuissimus TaxID=426638 RepID=A0AAD3D977_9STRA|nr:hypothetical protein CTEN210_16667 [Chaetoceros tenuissimus]
MSERELAQKRLLQIQGPGISFKRPRSEIKSPSEEINLGALDSLERHSSSSNPLCTPYGRCSNVSNRYEKIARIGEGTYGIVYKAYDKKANKGEPNVVALKRCLPHHEASDGFPITTLREIEILREIALEKGHDNIVNLREIAVGSKSSSVFLVFEFVQFELAKLIDDHYAKYSKSPFSLAETKCLSKQLFSALSFLHGKRIIHRDLKLSNLLYDPSRGLLKLADFGLARRISSDTCKGSEIGTESEKFSGKISSLFPSSRGVDNVGNLTPKVVSLWYRAPELLLNHEKYDIAIDQWSAGCVLSEFLLGKPLFKGKNDLDQLRKVIEVLGSRNCRDIKSCNKGSMEAELLERDCEGTLFDIFADLSSLGIQLFQNLLAFDPRKRISAEAALHCEWIREEPSACGKDIMPKFHHKM